MHWNIKSAVKLTQNHNEKASLCSTQGQHHEALCPSWYNPTIHIRTTYCMWGDGICLYILPTAIMLEAGVCLVEVQRACALVLLSRVAGKYQCFSVAIAGGVATSASRGSDGWNGTLVEEEERRRWRPWFERWFFGRRVVKIWRRNS